MSRSRILPQIAGPMTAFKTAALASLLVDQDFDVRCVADLVVRNLRAPVAVL